uniref:Hedgehog/Intein (Hint) domain-containing protein n=1 Tax=viral metagenome TaxID=1070528 RepID=A0A6C0KQM3_9ZZZZ
MSVSKWSRSITISPLVHPDLTSKPQNSYHNVLLIDKNVKNAQLVYDSANDSTFPILYSVHSSSQDLLVLLQTHFTSIQHVGLFFESSEGKLKYFLDMQPLFLNTENAPYSKNVAFMIQLIKTFSITGLDFLACDTLLHSQWTAYYEILMTETGVKVGASSDKTGNLQYGGDWVMESTSQNVELLYFTKNIEYYQYVLSPPTDIRVYTITYPGNVSIMLSIDVNSYFNVILFPTWEGGGSGYPLYTGPPSWLYDFQLWVAGEQIYHFSDLAGIYMESDGEVAFTDLNNPQAGCYAYWTSDQNVHASDCQNLIIDNLGYNDYIGSVSVNVACFKEGTQILTDKGYRAIETLRKGDKVRTLLRGFVPIELIGTRQFVHNANPERIKDQLYVCSKEAYPEATEDLVITGCHSLLVSTFANDVQKEKTKEVNGLLYVTDRKYRLPACADDRAVVYPTAGTYNIYHFALENSDYYSNYGVYANGILVETTSKRYMEKLSQMTLL